MSKAKTRSVGKASMGKAAASPSGRELPPHIKREPVGIVKTFLMRWGDLQAKVDRTYTSDSLTGWIGDWAGRLYISKEILITAAEELGLTVVAARRGNAVHLNLNLERWLDAKTRFPIL